MEATREYGPPAATDAGHTPADIDLNLDEAMGDLEINISEEDAAENLHEDAENGDDNAENGDDNAEKQQDAEAAAVRRL
ncbi:unnamed protein product [Closterium sp. Yama58-4]|nr:unnamed protein product [Closterium sp. Yama58-4]